ncbi:X-linked lymphocyte-regulated protein 3A-like [Mus pahari]|uniref:X-linked lymphocyte-regulated protein 3A-like n=1 Tax=Mus pahari TaxID=10093 RepID=UPI000A313ABC|nr:X-linked lymphocyte-regulated protein 3A-like [Mus pahari]
MSNRERKATESAGRHPRMDPNLSSDDSQNPGAVTAANREDLDADREDIISSGTERQQARSEPLKFLTERKEANNLCLDRSSLPIDDKCLSKPTKNALQENRERFSRIMTSSFYAIEVKIKDVLKTQCEQSCPLGILTSKVGEAERGILRDMEMLSSPAQNMFMEQQKFIHETLTLQKNRMEEFKSLCEEYLEVC